MTQAIWSYQQNQRLLDFAAWLETTIEPFDMHSCRHCVAAFAARWSTGNPEHGQADTFKRHFGTDYSTSLQLFIGGTLPASRISEVTRQEAAKVVRMVVEDRYAGAAWAIVCPDLTTPKQTGGVI